MLLQLCDTFSSQFSPKRVKYEVTNGLVSGKQECDPDVTVSKKSKKIVYWAELKLTHAFFQQNEVLANFLVNEAGENSALSKLNSQNTGQSLLSGLESCYCSSADRITNGGGSSIVSE